MSTIRKPIRVAPGLEYSTVQEAVLATLRMAENPTPGVSDTIQLGVLLLNLQSIRNSIAARAVPDEEVCDAIAT